MIPSTTSFSTRPTRKGQTTNQYQHQLGLLKMHTGAVYSASSISEELHNHQFLEHVSSNV
eukprot:scaffold10302_cov118-Cylindrotheca_fusiformis.AAC.2